MLDLRPARLDDTDAVRLIAEVQAYYVGLYGRPDEDPMDVDEYVPPRGGFVLGLVGDEPVAMGGWSFFEPGVAKVRRLYVRPSVRRHGFAAVLLDRLEADAAAAGATAIALETGSPQEDAVRFYRARGYVDIPPFGFHATSPLAVHLGKTLSPVPRS